MTQPMPPALLPEVLERLQANWAGWFPRLPRPRRLSYAIQGTGVGKLIIFILSGNARRPVCIVKLPRARRDNASLAHEQHIVSEMRHRGGSVAADALPVPIASFTLQGWQVVVEEVLDGHLFSSEVPSGKSFTMARAEEHLRQVRECYAALQLATREPVEPLGDAELTSLFLEPIEQARREAELRPHETRYLDELAAQAAGLAGKPLPLGFVHGDMRAGNILRSGGHLRLIDWQFGQLRALPMLDWYEFGFRYYCDAIGLAEITGDHDHYRAAFADVFLGASPYTELMARETLSCAKALGVNPDQLDLLASMWLVDNTNKYLAFLGERADHGYLYLMQNPPGGPFRGYRQQLRRQVYPCLLGQMAHSRQTTTLNHATVGDAHDSAPVG